MRCTPKSRNLNSMHYFRFLTINTIGKYLIWQNWNSVLIYQNRKLWDVYTPPSQRLKCTRENFKQNNANFLYTYNTHRICIKFSDMKGKILSNIYESTVTRPELHVMSNSKFSLCWWHPFECVLPSTICLIFSLYTLWPLESTYVRRKFLNLFLISVLGPNIDTHSLTECPFMSSRFSILSIICNTNSKFNFIFTIFNY